MSRPKAQILKALRGGPLHGYGIYQETKVPLGSMYRHLRELEREGFLKGDSKGRQRVYRLTAKGKKLLELVE